MPPPGKRQHRRSITTTALGKRSRSNRDGGREAAGAALGRPPRSRSAAGTCSRRGRGRPARPGPAAKVQPGPPPAGCGDRGRAPSAAEPGCAPPSRPVSAGQTPGPARTPWPRGRLRPDATRGSAAGPVARAPGTGAPLTVRLFPPLTRSSPAAGWKSESPASRGVPAPSPRNRPATAPAALRSRRPARPGPAPCPPQRPAPPRRAGAGPPHGRLGRAGSAAASEAAAAVGAEVWGCPQVEWTRETGCCFCVSFLAESRNRTHAQKNPSYVISLHAIKLEFMAQRKFSGVAMAAIRRTSQTARPF
ncbi:uncharacterized protein [Taeniopygia guttata]|uniref:uncharacterized protein n=1 Tax=Taeniopygia guttata TaxID=59729 RepID=UPI003BB8EB07